MQDLAPLGDIVQVLRTVVQNSARFALGWHEQMFQAGKGMSRVDRRSPARRYGTTRLGARTFPAMPMASEVTKFSSTAVWLGPLWFV